MASSTCGCIQENIAIASATLNLLEALLKEVAYRREQGRCRVLTQIDYVSQRRSDPEKG